jgi:hypothetical protein
MSFYMLLFAPPPRVTFSFPGPRKGSELSTTLYRQQLWDPKTVRQALDDFYGSDTFTFTSGKVA